MFFMLLHSEFNSSYIRDFAYIHTAIYVGSLEVPAAPPSTSDEKDCGKSAAMGKGGRTVTKHYVVENAGGPAGREGPWLKLRGESKYNPKVSCNLVYNFLPAVVEKWEFCYCCCCCCVVAAAVWGLVC